MQKYRYVVEHNSSAYLKCVNRRLSLTYIKVFTLNLEKLAPLQADKFGAGNPIEKEKKIVLGKFLSALIPKKTVIGQIPSESELVDTIGQLYEISPKFKQILDEIEYRGVK